MTDVNALPALKATFPKTYHWLGKLRWQTKFFVRYLLARAQWGALQKLQAVVAQKIAHSWVGDVTIELRRRPGAIDPKTLPLTWDAPVAVTVWRRKKKEDRAVQGLGMSLYLVGDVIYLVQLQGVASNVPKEWNWTRLLVEACQEFAFANGFREVRIPRARTMVSYRKPHIPPGDDFEARCEKIRIRMRDTYDNTARRAGFSHSGKWFVWPTYLWSR